MSKSKASTKQKNALSRKPVVGFKAATKAATKSASSAAKKPASRRPAGSTDKGAGVATAQHGVDSAHQTKVRLEAISANLAVIEFNMDGTIITANQNFLDATGYVLEEIQGRHHSIFVGAAYRASPEYKQFWDRLARGEADQGQYRRFRKDGSEVWLQASYSPLRNSHGVPYRVIKYASDITTAKQKQADSDSQLRSIGLYQAVIEFKLDGTIVTANQNFLDATGYTLAEIQGKHHSMFVEASDRQSLEYRAFWEKLGRGEAEGGQYRRIRKDGSEVWLQASYNPIFDLDGKPIKVIKYASDITKAKRAQADADSKLRSISLYQAVIEFKLDGTIVTANQNFLDAVGYSLAEIQGKHHSLFVDAAERQSQNYRYFWEKLGRGEADSGQYKRIRKDGSELWLQASYNPIFDLDGKAVKVIKYASDITASKKEQADAASQLRSIGSYQAIIEFKLDGTIVSANQNFLDAVGYSLMDIQGKHHSMFVEPTERQSQDYRYFWEKLGRGEADHGQYKRIRRDGREIWLQASYNPIFDLDGKPVKVIKYATDITDHKKLEQAMHTAMSETSRVMKALATGNLQETMKGEFVGEFAELRNSVNASVEHLRETVSRIRHAGSTLSVSASEIAIGNQDLSTRTEEQAATLASTATSMEQLTGTVKQNAGSAREANQLAAGARNEAERGGAVVEAAITAMKAINDSSNRIADIIGVIDEIAFQTNLLALNAAVEAARAGEQGRGFAVVAAEVRNLAQRSAGAAKEIKALIKDSVIKVDEGSRLVKESGTMLQQIVLAAKKVSDIISEIASASAEQAAGIDTIGEAIQKMDAVVQQNSALVEEAAAASAMMDEQTKDMDGLMQFFKLSDSDKLFTPSPRKETAVAKRVVKPSKAKLPGPSQTPVFSLTDGEEEF